MQNKAVKILKSTLRVLVGFLFVVSTLLTLLSGVMHYCLLNKEFYEEKIINEKYLTDVKAYAADDIAEECFYYGIEPQTIISCIDDQKIKDLSTLYIEGLYMFVDGRGELTKVHYPADDFYPAVKAHYTDLGDVNEEEDRALAQIFASRVDNNINSMTHLTAVVNIFRSPAADLVRRFTDGFWNLVLISVVLFLIFVALSYAKPLRWAQSSFGLLTVASVFTFIPLWCLKIFDLPSKLVLMDSPLKTLVDQLAYNSIDLAFRFMLITFLSVTTVFVVLSVALAVTQSKNQLKGTDDDDGDDDIPKSDFILTQI